MPDTRDITRAIFGFLGYGLLLIVMFAVLVTVNIISIKMVASGLVATGVIEGDEAKTEGDATKAAETPKHYFYQLYDQELPALMETFGPKGNDFSQDSFIDQNDYDSGVIVEKVWRHVVGYEVLEVCDLKLKRCAHVRLTLDTGETVEARLYFCPNMWGYNVTMDKPNPKEGGENR